LVIFVKKTLQVVLLLVRLILTAKKMNVLKDVIAFKELVKPVLA